MPDISKINALAIGSVGKVDGLAKASILDIDGVFVSAALNPTAAYSVRLLGSAVGISSYTGPAMRVRRETAGGTGDDDEADVAFDTSLTDPAISLDSAISNASVGVTATTLGQFLNVGTVGGTTYTNPDSLTVTASCFVDEWKDQSGNANHATQGTFGSQPQIHSGTVNTDLILQNGKPAIDFDGSDDFLNIAAVFTSNATISAFTVVTSDAVTSNGYIYDNSNSASIGGGYTHRFNSTGGFRIWAQNAQAAETSGTTANNTQYLSSRISTDNTTTETNTLFLNGSQTGTTTGTMLQRDAKTNTNIGRSQILGGYLNGRIQEIVAYSTNQITNRTGIESNINGFFGIY